MSKADAIRGVIDPARELSRNQIVERSGQAGTYVDSFLHAETKKGRLIRTGEHGAYFYRGRGIAEGEEPKRPPAERKKLRDITAKAKRPAKANGSALHELTAQSLAIAAKQLATKVRDCVDFEEVDELAQALAAFELAERIHEKAGGVTATELDA